MNNADVAEFLPAGRQGYTRHEFMYYVYVIQSLIDGSYYKGRTDNIDRRLKEHNLGKTQSNRIKRPFKLVHVEICESLKDSLESEKYLKSGYGRELIREINADVAELVYA